MLMLELQFQRKYVSNIKQAETHITFRQTIYQLAVCCLSLFCCSVKRIRSRQLLGSAASNHLQLDEHYKDEVVQGNFEGSWRIML